MKSPLAFSAAALLLTSLATVFASQASEGDEADLLDVGILVFDPGLPDAAAQLRELEAEGVFAAVRESEAIYIPVHLEHTLQSSGAWGAVRVVPQSVAMDVTVSGTILASNGEELLVDVRAVDSRGEVWLEKRYQEEADERAYEKGSDEPFHRLYDRIATDLMSKREKLSEEDVQTIATTSRIRFAADLAPVPLSDYLGVTKERYSLVRLPARDDPMMARVDRLRQRDGMFLDALNQYYADFYQMMEEPYRGWRAENYWEQKALDRPRRISSGGSVSAGGIAGGALPWEGTGGFCGTPAVLDGFEQREEPSERAAREEEARKKSHLAELRELGASLASDMAPQLVELEGKVLRLTGSVESQYFKWRQLLREIFAAETGLSPLSETPESDGL